MSTSPAEPGWTPGRRQRLDFKADRPRQIDRYIDYFGDGTASSAAASLEDHAAATWAGGGGPGHDAQTAKDGDLT